MQNGYSLARDIVFCWVRPYGGLFEIKRFAHKRRTDSSVNETRIMKLFRVNVGGRSSAEDVREKWVSAVLNASSHT